MRRERGVLEAAFFRPLVEQPLDCRTMTLYLIHRLVGEPAHLTPFPRQVRWTRGLIPLLSGARCSTWRRSTLCHCDDPPTLSIDSRSDFESPGCHPSSDWYNSDCSHPLFVRTIVVEHRSISGWKIRDLNWMGMSYRLVENFAWISWVVDRLESGGVLVYPVLTLMPIFQKLLFTPRLTWKWKRETINNDRALLISNEF